MCNHSKEEVIINFRIKNRGIFDIVEPVLENGEVFDSSLLRETINQQIVAGKRNFAIDLSLLDYIYSDTINVLMGLNKRILDVSVRLSLLAPQPEALQVLKRAGINNILRIFDTEADLLKTSEDIILQTTSFKVSDLQALANEKPQSEFDQLRSEIGSVFGGHDGPTMDQGMNVPKGVQQPPRPATPQPPAEVSPSVNEEFDQAFQQFEGFGDDDQSGFAQSQQPMQPSYTPPVQAPRNNAPSFRQPPPPSAPMQPPQFQGRQYVPPSPAPQTTRFDAVPKAPARPGYIPPEPPKAAPDTMSRTETQRFQTVPGSTSRPGLKMDQMPMGTGPIQDETLEDFPSAKKSKPKFVDDSDSLDSDDEFDSIGKKKSPVGIIVAIVVVILLGCIGAFFALNQMNSKPVKTVATKSVTPSVPPVPQVPVQTSTPQVTDSSSITAAVPAVTTQAPHTQEKAPEPVAVSKPKPTPKPVSKPKSKPRAVASSSYSEPVTPREPAAPKAVPSKVAITSMPSGASLEINGEIVGTTPYTWTKPVFGMVSVTARKSGYQENSITFEYTGGSSSQSITLEKEYTPPPAPVTSTPKSYTPVETTPPPTPAYEEPEPALPPPPPVSQPVATSSGDASIFIASIPPVADVYLDGRLIGKTNVSELKLPSGTHVLKFVKGPKEVTKEITVQSGKNPSQMVRLP
ncbi:MAG TPA: PEGA domain-containing protein [Chitinispirillaceae bacterium]|nr:PEGA domain-containing protein [Chitinispirillaceae bacterium]